ncbi:DUF421 domain-containing protein [Oceanobacillus piezotolerans]|uniref:DUF421 domain-containing protein n=1 Tax=Oceanobacillus piezotolerans TaxID=2448030 RepID=A0A498D9R4_9BACI|nr:DUF421 domain-containing protein [Oceanobacillus piezotolerans]RLL43670.1 DUF421 domain-containing protein [Oceanobacillus piezotolerans]
MPELVLILIRSISAFILLLIMTRIMGKKQLSQLTFFDYCVGITIGSIAATMSVDQNVKIANGLVSLTIWGLFPITLAFIGLKSRGFLRLTDGRPAIIIKDGEIFEETMKKNQLAINELMLLLREKGIFKVADVEMAIMETNGELSVMKKTELDPITPKLLGMSIEKEHAPTVLIMDGEILTTNLSALGYSKEWLEGEIFKQGATSIEDVFLAQVDSKGELYVDLYHERMKQNKIEERPLLAASLKKLQADLESFSLETENTDAKKMYKEQAKSLQNTIDSILPYLK